MAPKVSVVMSVYNGEKYLREAIESILSQTFRDFEFIIVDDGSIDLSWQIVTSYDDPRIISLRNDENVGLTRSLNKGIDRARGEYIARMDADDVSLPKRLELQVHWLDTHEQTDVLGTQVTAIDEGGKPVRVYRYRYPTDKAMIERMLLRGLTPLCHGSAMFKRRPFEKVGGYREQFKQAQDYDLWLRMTEPCGIGNLSEVVYQQRLLLDSIGYRFFVEQKRSAAFALQCAERRREGLPEPATPPLDQPPTRAELGEYHTLLGRAFLDLNRPDEARAEFRRAVRNSPGRAYAWFFYLGSLVGKSFLDRAFSVAQGILRVLPWLRKDPLGPFRR